MSGKSPTSRVVIIAAVIGTLGPITAAFIHIWGPKISQGSEETRQTNTVDPPGNREPNQRAEKIDLSGTWYMQTTTQETSYNRYKGLIIRYKILLTQEGNSITANGNKFGEVFHGKACEYTGKAKTPISLAGSGSHDGSGQTIVGLNGWEDGTERKSLATSFLLRVLDHTRMVGTFSSTAADAKGTAVWISEDEWQRNGWD